MKKSLYDGTAAAALDGLQDQKDVDRIQAAIGRRERKKKKREENIRKACDGTQRNRFPVQESVHPALR